MLINVIKLVLLITLLASAVIAGAVIFIAVEFAQEFMP